MIHPPRLRIALAVTSLNIGGTETQLCRLAQEFRARGHAVKVFAFGEGGPLENELHDAGISFDVIGFGGLVYRDAVRGLLLRELVDGVAAIGEFWQALWKFRPHVCHAFLGWANLFGIPGAAIVRIPGRIAGRRGLPPGQRMDPHWLAVHRLSVLCSHAIVANSRAVALAVGEAEPAARRKLHVIPNGVDMPAATADVATQPAEGVMVANLIDYKGHRDLIEALSQLSNPPVVHLIGDGKERYALTALVAARGLTHAVTFEGSIPRARESFVRAQFAVLASHEEGMPNAILEAMAYGVPVIATDVGGVPELVRDGIEGILVPPKRPDQLAAAIARLAGDAALRRRLGSAARSRAREFSWTRCVSAHEDLYYALMRDSHKHRRRSPFRDVSKRPTKLSKSIDANR